MTTLDQPHQFLQNGHIPEECLICPFGEDAVIHHRGEPAASEENCCEHGDHPAPPGKRFCSSACMQCEAESEHGCDGLCGRILALPKGVPGAYSGVRLEPPAAEGLLASAEVHPALLSPFTGKPRQHPRTLSQNEALELEQLRQQVTHLQEESTRQVLERREDVDLLKRAVDGARTSISGGHHPRWLHVSQLFAVGSRRAMELCRRFGLEPDEMVRFRGGR